MQRTPIALDFQVSWQNPPDNWIKINVDGAWNECSRAIAAAGLIRNHKREWQVGFVHNIGKGNTLLAEAWAAVTVVQLAIERGYTNVILESDSIKLVQFVNQTLVELCEPSLCNIIGDIKCGTQTIPQFIMRHCYMESTLCPDSLAKLAFFQALGVHILLTPPHVVHGFFCIRMLVISQWLGGVLLQIN